MPLTRVETTKESHAVGKHTADLIKIDPDTTGLEFAIDLANWPEGAAGTAKVEVTYDGGVKWELFCHVTLRGGILRDREGNALTHRIVRVTWERDQDQRIVRIPGAARVEVDLLKVLDTSIILEARP